jgi:hypothetical protein
MALSMESHAEWVLELSMKAYRVGYVLVFCRQLSRRAMRSVSGCLASSGASIALSFLLTACASVPGRIADLPLPASGQSVRDSFLLRTPAELKPYVATGVRVWGVAMDVAYRNGVDTYFGFADGSALWTSTESAKPYASAGHPALVLTALETVALARTMRQVFSPTTDLGFPPSGSVRIFVIGGKSLLSTPVFSIDDISKDSHPYNKLWVRIHDVGALLVTEPSL